jgi:hypothetical protein
MAAVAALGAFAAAVSSPPVDGGDAHAARVRVKRPSARGR